MGMQVASLHMGTSVAVAAPQEFQQDKKISLPMERKMDAEQEKADIERMEASLPGNRTPQAAELRQTTSDLEQIGLAFNRRLKFEVDQDSRQILIKVIDNETDKVIRVIPPEELQRLHSSIRETIGLLFDKKV